MKEWACVAWIPEEQFPNYSPGLSIKVMENAYGAGKYQDHEGPIETEYVHQVRAVNRFIALRIATNWFLEPVAQAAVAGTELDGEA